MKITNLDERVHVLDNHTNVWSVLRDIAESGVQEEAFYVCDIGEIVQKHKIWKLAMPRVEPHYAVKCNDSLTVIETLAALGTSFDCASKGEINKVLDLGVEPSRIIFANPAKPISHIRHAASVGVDTMTFDNESELHKVRDLFPTAKLVIRIRCDDPQAQCQLGMKFGCDYITEAPRLLRLAMEMNLNVIGVSFHVGSGCSNPPIFRQAIQYARHVFDFAASIGYNFHLLDIGGGFPGLRGTSIDKIAEVVNIALNDYFPDPSVHVIAEPGRFYVASAYTLACNIHSVRRVELKDPANGTLTAHNMYYINDGVYGSFNCMLYDHQHVTPLPLKEYVGNKLTPSSVWGPTCDGLDQVSENILLPEMKIGDWLVFEDMGAYTLPVASHFNGFPVPKVHVVADESVWLLLKDMLPLSEDHFVIGNTPANLRIGLDIDGKDMNPWSINPIPLQLPIIHDSPIGEHVFEYVEMEAQE